MKRDGVMIDVGIKNPNILNHLNNWKDFVLSSKDDIDNNLDAQKTPGQRSKGVSATKKYHTDEYRNHIINKGPRHDGFPEVGYYYQLKPDQLIWHSDDKTFQNKHIDQYTQLNESMIYELGIRRNALCVAYPEDGFIGWHNNANASAYNLIFTYSETGDGYWQHVDPHTNEVVTVPDVPGWQCKAFYFGSYKENDPKTLIYHTAKTNSCWRLTVSYIFDRVNKEWWEQAIEEIEAP